MFLNQYSVRVLGSSAREVRDGYVEIGHGTQYSLVLGNHDEVDCDARVQVDGKDCGIFRLYRGQSFTLERPENDTGRFTAHLADSAEGQQGGLSAGDNMNGLIQVTFMPARRSTGGSGVALAAAAAPRTAFRHAHPTGEPRYTTSHSTGPQTVNSGRGWREIGTTLTGESGQRFRTVDRLDYDHARFVTISLRLVSPEANQTGFVRPLVSSGNPVPPPVRPLR